MPQLVSVSASIGNSKVRSSNPAGKKEKFFDWITKFFNKTSTTTSCSGPPWAFK